MIGMVCGKWGRVEGLLGWVVWRCGVGSKRVCEWRGAVDRAGKTVDFRLSARRDVAAAKAFFAKAITSQGLAPKTITLDGYAASHRAVREMKADEALPKETTLRSSKYLNNLIQQDHRNIKSRINAMLGFKRFGNTATTIASIELMHRIRKGQFGPFCFFCHTCRDISLRRCAGFGRG